MERPEFVNRIFGFLQDRPSDAFTQGMLRMSTNRIRVTII